MHKYNWEGAPTSHPSNGHTAGGPDRQVDIVFYEPIRHRVKGMSNNLEHLKIPRLGSANLVPPSGLSSRPGTRTRTLRTPTFLHAEGLAHESTRTPIVVVGCALVWHPDPLANSRTAI